MQCFTGSNPLESSVLFRDSKILNYLVVYNNIREYAGLIADVDIESEKYRWMGSTRLDFYVCQFFWSFPFEFRHYIHYFIHAYLYCRRNNNDKELVTC